MTKLKSECEIMRNKFPGDIVPLEVLAQMSVDNKAGTSHIFLLEQRLETHIALLKLYDFYLKI